VRVQATEPGASVHERIRAQRGAVVSACAARLSPEHLAALTASLPALEALAEELCQPDSAAE